MSKLKLDKTNYYDNLIGNKYEKLTIVGYEHHPKRSENWLICKCDCGNITHAYKYSLESGKKKSCGCLWRENIKSGEARKKHGMRWDKAYRSYMGLKNRCLNSNSPAYKNYGGRGIKVCDEWLGENGFENYYQYVSKLEHYNEKGYTLDRIDNNGNYEPNNVRYADRKTQAYNKRSTIILTYKGETHNLAEWSEIVGISRRILAERLRRGLSIEQTLTMRKWGDTHGVK